MSSLSIMIIMVIVDTSYTTGNMFIRERVITADGVFAMLGTTPYVKGKEDWSPSALHLIGVGLSFTVLRVYV
ncbi:hypothetical protein PRIPAC_82821 [Pristionchus pacificus]|uniref:Uncharacterized protein n=1 Tax=Pristionchus pacificus TaxID=54126 RepID=A0A2A6C2D2_PRIPA|nr:hypothetical protein PRIPAC_82821 [Pristionchus pacificus]|eukprot:PDM72296.1 hypothetical protein PRIPAC_38730 [Pristionchus pacificus]